MSLLLEKRRLLIERRKVLISALKEYIESRVCYCKEETEGSYAHYCSFCRANELYEDLTDNYLERLEKD